MLNKEVCDFYRRFFETFKHPFNRSISQPIKAEELDLALDFLEEILATKVSEERLQEIASRFNAAFENYINLPRIQIGALCNSIEKLASLLDPFLKKLVFVFYPQEKIKKGNKLIPLWKVSDFADILDTLKISKVNLRSSEVTFWEQQSCEQAILRIGFVTRHKGVHESHRYTLQELENIAYATIGSYLVICLQAMQYPSIKKSFKKTVELRHFITLLKGKTEAYNTTGTLLSKNEHLNIYRYRSNVEPTLEEARFLLTCYFSSAGPVFFWLKKYNKNLKIKWASDSLKIQDESIRRNAMRYLIENGKRFPLKDIVDLFPYYELKVELAEYIRRFSTKRDISRLLHLYRNKAEEVASAAFEALCRLVRTDDNPILNSLALSKSMSKQYLLQSLVRQIAKKAKLEYYRQFQSINNKAQQLISLYCLGEVGTQEDIKLIKNWLNARKRNKHFRYVGWYAIGRIASRIGNSNLVAKLIKSKDDNIRYAAFESITREGIGANFNYLISCQKISEEFKCEVISRIAQEDDLELVKNYMRCIELDNTTRKLVLTVCRYGRSNEFDFLIDLFSNCPSKIEFWNHVRVASEISKLCTRRHIPYLKKMINSPEFWEYFGRKRSKNNPMPVKNYGNLPLIKRIISAAFCKVANEKEMAILRRLLEHDYKWISLNASLSLAQFADEKELDWLVQEALSSKDKFQQEKIITALCLLDKTVYEQ